MCTFSIRVLVIIIPLILRLGTCYDGQTNQTLSGVYFYTAFDSAGARLVEGTLSLTINDSSVTGEWHLSKISTAQNIGPQVGSGQLQGSMHDGTLSLNLNPQWVDNNVFLFGKIENSIFRGSWSWSTFVGITNAGSFEARKTLLFHDSE